MKLLDFQQRLFGAFDLGVRECLTEYWGASNSDQDTKSVSGIKQWLTSNTQLIEYNNDKRVWSVNETSVKIHFDLDWWCLVQNAG